MTRRNNSATGDYMRSSISTMFNGRSVLALAAVAFLSGPSWAQQTISRVVTTVVKPDRVADYEAAVKQYNEIYAKIAGARARTMFQSMTGPNQFRRIISYDKWCDLDRGPGAEAFIGNAELARINARIQSCIQSSTT